MVGHFRFHEPRDFIRETERIWGNIREAAAEVSQEMRENDKRDRAHMSTKRHKRDVIPRKRKNKSSASPLLTKMLEPVVDPGKKEREAAFLKNPFAGLDRGRR